MDIAQLIAFCMAFGTFLIGTGLTIFKILLKIDKNGFKNKAQVSHLAIFHYPIFFGGIIILCFLVCIISLLIGFRWIK